MKQHLPTLLLTLAAIGSPATAQKLRRAVAAADLVVVAKAVRVVPAKTHVIHQLLIEEVLRGPRKWQGVKKVSVVVPKRLSVHNRPVAAKSMLLCLHDARRIVDRVGLPKAFAPYFTMSGHPGSAVVLDKNKKQDPRLEFARVLAASQKGTSPRQVAERLFTIATRGDKRIRIEAAQTLTERSVLAGYLTKMHLSNAMARAAGEVDDIPYKIALATICVERREPAIIPTLAVSVEHVGDASFLRALGRFARFLHKEDAAKALLPHLERAKGRVRERLIYALGATSTGQALDALLDMHKSGEYKAAVQAALEVHGSPKAAAAIGRKRDR